MSVYLLFKSRWNLWSDGMRYLIIFFLLSPNYALAQFGNEWINFNQSYFRIPVGKNGLHRVTYSSLVAAGVPTSINPKSIRLYHRGVEQAIIVQGEGDEVLNNTDYVEFYGRRNDGSQDAQLYRQPEFQPHKRYNLFSDTTSYFLTYGGAVGKRMTVVEEPSGGLPPEDAHWDHRAVLKTEYYHRGIDYGSVHQAYYDRGEGWMTDRIHHGQSATFTIDGISNRNTAAGDPSIEINLTGAGPMPHVVELYAGSRLITTLNFSGYTTITNQQALQWSDISADGKVDIIVKVLGFSGQSDRVCVSYVDLSYPQHFNAANGNEKLFTLKENPTGKSFLQIQNVPVGSRLFDVTDPSNARQIATVVSGTFDAVVTGTSSSRQVFLTSTATSAQIVKVTFRPISPVGQDYVIISHKSLRRPASGYTDPVKAYGEYRSYDEGGGFDTLIVNVDQLYNQFNYGEQSPLAIVRFLKYISSTTPPKYLFLIGKGLLVEYNYHRGPATPQFATYKDLVPTFGFPASDMAFSASPQSNSHVPAIPTGRLSASSADEVAAYLKKVIAMESLPFDALWRKNILHLSGGLFDGEPQRFKSHLEAFASTAEATYLGGKVTAIAKQNTSQRLVNVSDEVNNGLNLITFFGHSGVTDTDFDIGSVTDPVLGYNNKGKYPALLLNGCYAGSAYHPASIFTENWVNASERGAIGVIAHSFLGIEFQLRNYSSLFYSTAYGNINFINKGLGDVQKEVARQFLGSAFNEQGISQVQQMILLGDPAYKLFGAGKPDYEISGEGLSMTSFTGEPVTALLDSFKVNFNIRNYGIATTGALKVSVTQEMSDGSNVVYDSIISAVLNNADVSMTIKGDRERGIGINKFTIVVDPQNANVELKEDNNARVVEFFIPVSQTQNLFPNNFAVVNTPTVNLTVQHTDNLSGTRDFIIEVDTVHTFNSSYRKSFTKSGDVIATHAMTLLSQDSLTYYWRTKLADPSANESEKWQVSSFTYIHAGPQGWAQMHFPQFTENDLSGMSENMAARRLDFDQTVTDIDVRTFGAAAGKPTDSVSVRINGAEYNIYQPVSGFRCRDNTINFIAFNRKTTQPYPGIYLTWIDLLYTYGGERLLCGREPYVINSYRPSEMAMGNDKADVIKYVDNIPVGDSVLMFNIGDAGYASWPAAAKLKLQELGIAASQIESLQPGEPVVIFGKKGAAAGTATVFRSSATPVNTSRLKVNTTVTGRNATGMMIADKIGPALSWGNFIVDLDEVHSSDEVAFDIYGIRNDGTQLIIKEGQNDIDLSDIDANTYPFLRIAYSPTDETELTPPQINKWIVTFNPVAEGLVLYDGSSEQQNLFEGQKWNGAFKFVNISATNFSDSIEVHYDIVNPGSFSKTEGVKRIKSPSASDTTKFILTFPTLNQEGLNNVEVFANPRVQPEQRYDNNILVLREHILVEPDVSDPVLDVLIDGRHIQNEDFVSPQPEIKISLWDDNPYLLKTDTTGVSIFLGECLEECIMKRVFFSDPAVSWTPETEQAEFTAILRPSVKAGLFKLRVEATDANGNASGIEPYEITFRVDDTTKVIIHKPYPNPFYHKASFDFTIGGELLPDQLSIQIVSARGEVVQQFHESSFESIHFGVNTFTWSGTNEKGSTLPAGIYFYRVIVIIDDKKIEKNGKLVLVR